MKTLIIGNGEIGRALEMILEKHYKVYIRDLVGDNIEGIEILHICFPYSKDFVQHISTYQNEYKPRYTVIHSTVPVGVSRKCEAYHSPVRGIHPNLRRSLLTFVKYLAPKNKELAQYFQTAGMIIAQVEKSESTELAKILSTTKYGLDIIFNKEVYRLCQEHKVDFDMVYTDWTKTYNLGYGKLGESQFTRPILKYIKGRIGGHCVTQNLKLLESWLTDLIKSKNG